MPVINTSHTLEFIEESQFIVLTYNLGGINKVNLAPDLLHSYTEGDYLVLRAPDDEWKLLYTANTNLTVTDALTYHDELLDQIRIGKSNYNNNNANYLVGISAVDTKLVTPDNHDLSTKISALVLSGRTIASSFLLGRKSIVYDTETICVPVLGSYGTTDGVTTHLPPTATQMQIASTSANDTAAGTGARIIKIIGMLGNYSTVSEEITLNGQTPVTTVNSFLRVFAGSVVSSGSTLTTLTGTVNQGNIFVSTAANTFTAGVPDDKNLIVAVMEADQGTLDSCVVSIPPIPNVKFYLNEINLSVLTDGGDRNLILNLKGKIGNSGWRNFYTINASTTQPTLTVKIDAFPNFMSSSTPTDMTDFILSIKKTPGGSSSAQIKISAVLGGSLVIGN